MDLLKVLGVALVLCGGLCSASHLYSADFYEPRGQRICRRGTERHCYKITYFQDSRRKVSYEEASRACRSEGGELLSIESEQEQRLMESFIRDLRAADGDFWVGLRRSDSNHDTSSNCPAEYHWVDGSLATFRNWHQDEPSCGFEMCVVMYHQPSAPQAPALGGPYMFQWNDDKCDTRNNFICKYTREKPATTTIAANASNTEDPTMFLIPKYPSVTADSEETKVHVSASGDQALHIAYVVLPTVSLLLLLLLVSVVLCFKFLVKKKKQRTETLPKEAGYWASEERCNSPSPDVYNVIRRQHEADLTSTRPDTKNTSFLGSSPDTPPGDYDNLASRDTESGFVTLASTESGFVTNELYEMCPSRGRYYRDVGWVDGEIYGY